MKPLYRLAIASLLAFLLLFTGHTALCSWVDSGGSSDLLASLEKYSEEQQRGDRLECDRDTLYHRLKTKVDTVQGSIEGRVSLSEAKILFEESVQENSD